MNGGVTYKDMDERKTALHERDEAREQLRLSIEDRNRLRAERDEARGEVERLQAKITTRTASAVLAAAALPVDDLRRGECSGPLPGVEVTVVQTGSKTLFVGAAPQTETRNSVVLQAFASYCEAHPDQRFWQALRNWSGAQQVIYHDKDGREWPTFYWENGDGPEGATPKVETHTQFPETASAEVSPSRAEAPAQPQAIRRQPVFDRPCPFPGPSAELARARESEEKQRDQADMERAIRDAAAFHARLIEGEKP